MHRIRCFALVLTTSMGLATAQGTTIAIPSLNPGVVDSLLLADSALIVQTAREIETTLREQQQKDSVLFSNRLPEDIRAKAAEAAKLFGLQKQRFDSARLADPTRIEEFKSTVEQWRRAWESKRDSQVAKIADPNLRSTIQTRITQVTRRHAAVFAQLRERRQTIQTRMDDLKARRPTGKKPPNP